MIPGQLFGIGAKDLGIRFNLIGTLPSAALVLFILAAAWSGAPGDRPDLDRVVTRAQELGADEAALLAVGVLVVSLLLHPLQGSLVRLLEGYWGTSQLAGIVARPLTERHERRRSQLDDRAELRVEPGKEITAEARQRVGSAFWRRRMLYADGPLLPTLLGNVLRAAERRAGERYGLDTVVVWPRLYPLLSEGLREALADARNQLDMAARFCLTFGLGTIASVAFFAAHGWWLAVAAGMLALAWLSYRGAVGAALSYGNLIEAAFDLQRFDLLEALHQPLPVDLADERRANADLSTFLRGQGFLVNLRYDHGQAVDVAPKEGQEAGDDAGQTRTPAA
jgi:hypothetical protein